jgi:hypothetical protein
MILACPRLQGWYPSLATLRLDVLRKCRLSAISSKLAESGMTAFRQRLSELPLARYRAHRKDLAPPEPAGLRQEQTLPPRVRRQLSRFVATYADCQPLGPRSPSLQRAQKPFEIAQVCHTSLFENGADLRSHRRKLNAATGCD